MRAWHRQVVAYLAAPVLIGVAVGIRHALIGDRGEPESDLLLLAVVLAGAAGGLGPAIVATVVGLLEEAYFQARPFGSFRVADHRDRVELAIFLITGVAIAATFEIVKRMRRREAAVRRTLAMVTRCNEAILRAATEEDLYAEVCKVIVQEGGYRMCWVGLAEHDGQKTLRPVAHAGHEDGYLRDLDITWADEPRGRGPSGTAAREGRIVVGRDFASDPNLAPWKEGALRRGYRSVTSIPVTYDGRVFAIIAMYSGEVTAFSREELRSLKRLSKDIAFGVNAIRQRAARDQQEVVLAAKDRALRASEEQFRTYVEAAPLGIFVVDGRGRYHDFNPAALEMIGIDGPTLRGMSIADLVEEEDRPHALATFGTLVATGSMNQDIRLRRGDGGHVWVALRSVKIADDRYMAFCQDITERQQAAEALRESERRYRTLVNGMASGLVLQTTDGTIVDCNPAAERLLGLSVDEMRGRKSVDPRWRAIREDGSPYPGEEHPPMVALRTGKTQVDVVMAVHKPDGEVTWLSVNAEPLRDDTGKVHAVLSTFVNVTRRREAEAERARLQAQLAYAARLAAMGTLVAGVAHEINNPLSALTSNAGTVLEDVRAFQGILRGGADLDRALLDARTSDVLEMLVDVSTSAERISRIVKDLTILGRPDQPRTRVRLSDVVVGALRWLPASLTGRASIRTELREVPDVMASASQMEQVLINLLANAALSFPDGRPGRIVVRLGPGGPGRVRVEVEDDGPGIAPELLERIFEPFFTTRPPGKGTGLGLSICNAIVGAHEGTISVASVPGKGATFRVELPAVAA
jgi:PAS domain S-box-containing protein